MPPTPVRRSQDVELPVGSPARCRSPQQAGASQRQQVTTASASARPAQLGRTRSVWAAPPPPPPVRRGHTGPEQTARRRRRHQPSSAVSQDRRRQDGTAASPSAYADTWVHTRQRDGAAATVRPAHAGKASVDSLICPTLAPGRASADRTSSSPPPDVRAQPSRTRADRTPAPPSVQAAGRVRQISTMPLRSPPTATGRRRRNDPAIIAATASRRSPRRSAETTTYDVRAIIPSSRTPPVRAAPAWVSEAVGPGLGGGWSVGHYELETWDGVTIRNWHISGVRS